MSTFLSRIRWNLKRRIAGGILLAFLFFMESCGNSESPDAAVYDPNIGRSVPVAEFHDMRLPGTLDYFWKYAVSEDWLYCVSRKREPGATQRNIWLVYRNGIQEVFDPEIYIEREGGLPLVLLAGSEGSCFLFCQDDNGEFSLEKYDATGEMQWHRGYAAASERVIKSSDEYYDIGIFRFSNNISS